MTPALPRAVLFDLDDTILVFDAASPAAWSAACRRLSHRLDGIAPETLSEAFEREGLWYWGDPARHVEGRLDIRRAWKKVARGALRRVGIDDEGLMRDMGEAYSEERIAAIRPIPGALDVLARLRSAGVATALVTNGGAAGQRAKIDRFGLEPLFDYILIEGEFGTGKPDRTVFLHALERLDAAPQDAWMVGDKLDFDIASPKLLGMHTVWIDVKRTGLPDDAPARPDRVIDSIADLLPDDVAAA